MSLLPTLEGYMPDFSGFSSPAWAPLLSGARDRAAGASAFLQMHDEFDREDFLKFFAEAADPAKHRGRRVSIRRIPEQVPRFPRESCGPRPIAHRPGAGPGFDHRNSRRLGATFLHKDRLLARMRHRVPVPWPIVSVSACRSPSGLAAAVSGATVCPRRRRRYAATWSRRPCRLPCGSGSRD
jgi:hypothetical protein